MTDRGQWVQPVRAVSGDLLSARSVCLPALEPPALADSSLTIATDSVTNLALLGR